MPRFKHTIEIECSDADSKAVKAILDKYAFRGEGVKLIDEKMTKMDFLITPQIKKLVVKR